jgi:hypothetical protein
VGIGDTACKESFWRWKKKNYSVFRTAEVLCRPGAVLLKMQANELIDHEDLARKKHDVTRKLKLKRL